MVSPLQKSDFSVVIVVAVVVVWVAAVEEDAQK